MGIKTIALVFVFMVVLAVLNAVIYRSSGEPVSFVVNEKDRITTCSSSDNGTSCSSKYLVFTDNEVFENTDKLILFKFNSSDVHARMVDGSKCTAMAYGWRVPFLSWYRNLHDVQCERN